MKLKTHKKNAVGEGRGSLAKYAELIGVDNYQSIQNWINKGCTVEDDEIIYRKKIVVHKIKGS